MQEQINKLIAFLTRNLYERDEAIRLTLLAMLGNESIFLYGKPGLGKSYIARDIKNVIKNGSVFEYLMSKYSTPEEIFGPLDINKLTEGKYHRITEGYLPTADIAFLDEIWKSGPSIQNTLLTIINEKEFRNGNEFVKVPLKLLIAASNEFPEEGQGLEALYDRFLLRYETSPISDFDNILKMAGVGTLKEDFKLDQKDLITSELLKSINSKISEPNYIKFSNEAIDFLNQFKFNLEAKSSLYVSDRRWKKTLQLMKVSAYCSDRDTVEIVDTYVINHTFWNYTNNNGADERTEINLLYNDIVQKFTGASDDTSWAETEIKSLTNNAKNYLKNDSLDKEYIKELGQRYRNVIKRLSSENKIISKFSSVFFPNAFDKLSGVNGEIRIEFEKTLSKLQKKSIITK